MILTAVLPFKKQINFEKICQQFHKTHPPKSAFYNDRDIFDDMRGEFEDFAHKYANDDRINFILIAQWGVREGADPDFPVDDDLLLEDAAIAAYFTFEDAETWFFGATREYDLLERVAAFLKKQKYQTNEPEQLHI